MADLVSVVSFYQPLEMPVNFEHKSVDDSQSSAVQEINKLLDDDYDYNTQYKPLKGAKTSAESLEQDADGSENINGSAKKEKRKVQFPTDSDIVKGYLDPPDPWRDVPDWQTEDLLQAYKQGCEKHGVKPLNKVLQQLQCIENIGDRYDILSLKGERLDLRHCESLEEILKYVRFRCIDLEATHLDDEMAVALFEMVEYYESACKLNISFNKGISVRGWQSCARLIRKAPCLTFIDAHNCDLNENVVPILGRSLRMGCFLQRLHLQNCNLAGRALLILVAALKVNDVLTELFLGDNKLLPTDGIQIGNLLKYNHKLELLDLRNNHLQDVGVGHICDGLVEQTRDSGLLTLVLWNNQITFQGIAAINRALTTADHLETLNLGHNLITNEGIHILKDGLLKSKGLLKLGLAGTKVSCEGAVALAEVIADNTRLVRLDLQENDIKTAGLMALSLALKVNENLTRLDVDRDTKKETGVKDYVEQQKRLKNDINKLVDRNKDIKNKREENQIKEIISKENVKNLEETVQDLVSLETNNEYIPTSDTVQRPKLLLIPHSSQVCPEQELDSPLGGEFVFEQTSPVATLQLIPPNGADLLSPQYCSNPKATTRKIFSVAKVAVPLSPSTLCGIDANSGYALSDTNLDSTVINSPTQIGPSVETGEPFSEVVIPHLCSPLPTVHFPDLIASLPHDMHLNLAANMNSPSSVQKDIKDEILVSFLNIDDYTDEPVVTTKDNVATYERSVQLDDAIKDVDQLIQDINENIGNIQNEHNANVAFDFNVSGNLTQTPEDDLTVMKTKLVVNKSCNSDSFDSYVGEVFSKDSVPTQIGDIKENTDVKTNENNAIKNTTLDTDYENGDKIIVSTKLDIRNGDTSAKLMDVNNPVNTSVTSMGVNINDTRECRHPDFGDILKSAELNVDTVITDNKFDVNGNSENICKTEVLEANVKAMQSLLDMDADSGSDIIGCNVKCDANNIACDCLVKSIRNEYCSSNDNDSNIIGINCEAFLDCSNPSSLPKLDPQVLSERAFPNKEEDSFNSDFVDCVEDIKADIEDNHTKDSVSSRTVNESGCDAEKESYELLDTGNNNTFRLPDFDHLNHTSIPDFYTNLSLNGLKQELETLLDEEKGFSQNGDPETTLSYGGHQEPKSSHDANDTGQWFDTASLEK